MMSYDRVTGICGDTELEKNLIETKNTAILQNAVLYRIVSLSYSRAIGIRDDTELPRNLIAEKIIAIPQNAVLHGGASWM